jgi:hypothetical protein
VVSVQALLRLLSETIIASESVSGKAGTAQHRRRTTRARTPILMLINGLDIRIVHATTGDIIREPILNPAIDCQTRGLRKPRPKPN